MVVVELVNIDQPALDLELVPELLEPEQEFDLQGPEPDFELQDPEPDLQDLYCIYNLILDIWISGIRGIWSIHLDLNISEPFLTLSVQIFRIYISIYQSSLQVKFTQQLSLNKPKSVPL